MDSPSSSLDGLRPAVAGRDAAAVAAVLAPEATVELPQTDVVLAGRSDAAGAVATVLAAFPDLGYVPVRRYLDGAETVEEGIWTGTHGGDFLGRPATGTAVSVRSRIIGSEAPAGLSDVAVYADLAALFDALGEPPPAGASPYVGPVADGVAGGQLAILAPEAPAPVRRRRRFLAAAGVLAALAVGAGTAVSILGDDTGGSDVVAEPAATTSATPSPTPSAPPPTPGPTAPPTPAETPTVVDSPVPAERQLNFSSDVLFEVDSAALTGRARQDIQGAAEAITEAGITGIIEVRGHTDSTGSASSNVRLSRARAEAVARELARDLAGQDVTIVDEGFGESNPVASNDTAEGRRQNRRVTIVLPEDL